MRADVANTANVHAGTVSSQGRELHRSVALIVAPKGRISPSLLHALEREFPRVDFEQTSDIRDAFNTFENQVKLVLIDAALLADIEVYALEFRIHHGGALIAVMLGNRQAVTSVASAILRSTVVRSVLPMDVRLDVWLSIVRLLLAGGHYLPSSLVDTYRRRQADRLPESASSHRGQRMGRAGSGAVESLTERQTQILEMVSLGYPNKIIASKLDLSQNTVKVHIHNFIEKLGARNRTEAAAIYHEHRSARDQ